MALCALRLRLVPLESTLDWRRGSCLPASPYLRAFQALVHPLRLFALFPPQPRSPGLILQGFIKYLFAPSVCGRTLPLSYHPHLFLIFRLRPSHPRLLHQTNVHFVLLTLQVRLLLFILVYSCPGPSPPCRNRSRHMHLQLLHRLFDL